MAISTDPQQSTLGWNWQRLSFGVMPLILQGNWQCWNYNCCFWVNSTWCEPSCCSSYWHSLEFRFHYVYIGCNESPPAYVTFGVTRRPNLGQIQILFMIDDFYISISLRWKDRTVAEVGKWKHILLSRWNNRPLLLVHG